MAAKEMDGHKTHNGWTAEGRIVKSGERALKYRVNSENTEGYALFSIEQTRQLTDLEGPDWRTVGPDRWRNLKSQRNTTEDDGRPRVIIDYKNEMLNVWCGPNSTAIGWMKGSGWRFEPNSHRWWKRGPVEKAVELAAFYEEQGFAVKREYHDPNGPPL